MQDLDDFDANKADALEMKALEDFIKKQNKNF